MQQKTRALSLLLGIAGFFTLAGCSGIETPGPRDPEEKPHAGLTLRVACPDPFSRSVIDDAASGWAHRVGLRKLETTLYDPDSIDALDEQADVCVLPAGQLPRWAAAGSLAPLPDEFTRPGGPVAWTSLLPIYREQLLVWEKTRYAVPLLGDAPLCFYRKDWLGEPRYKEGLSARGRLREHLNKPAEWDWEDFAAIAEYFRAARQSSPSLPPLPAKPRELDRLFCTIAASIARRAVSNILQAGKDVDDADLFSFHFDVETGAPRISTPGFVEALVVLQRLQACTPEKASPEPWQHFRDGEAVLCLGDARLLGEFQAHGSPVRDRVGVCPVPGSRLFFAGRKMERRTIGDGAVNRVPYLGAGAYLLAVPRSARQPEAAFELLAELAGRKMSQQLVLEPRWAGGVTRAEHFELSWDCWRLDPKEEGKSIGDTIRRTLQHNLRNPLLCLRVPREREFRQALVEELRPALRAGKAGTSEEASAILQAVKRRWEQVIAGRPAEHARDYRLSLGLTR